jgi:Domain of unknown function (DUF4158)
VIGWLAWVGWFCPDCRYRCGVRVYGLVCAADFLSDAQVAAYGRFTGVPSRPELERFFFLDERGWELIVGRRGDHSRLGLSACG